MGLRIAVLLHRWTRGRVTPNAVTLFGLGGHLPVAILVATGHHVLAAAVFLLAMLSDAVDGELARIQHRASEQGMLLDATADRIEEVLMYCGICYYISTRGPAVASVWALAACGTSLSVSYLKAKGEVAYAIQKASVGRHIPHEVLNQKFQVGVGGLKIRRYVSAAGLATGFLVPMSIILTALSMLTLAQRWFAITKTLSSDPKPFP